MTTRICRVRPDVAAVSRAFDYLVPEDLGAALRVGAVVRVPLHGRRVRGWVVADGVEAASSLEPDRLVPVHRVVSAGPPPAVVDLCDWAAWRWAGPVIAFLRAASPHNLVDPLVVPEVHAALHPVTTPPLALGATEWPADGVTTVTWPPGTDRRELVRSCCAGGGSTLVVVPEPARAGALVRALAREGRVVLHHHSGLSDRERTVVWAESRRGAAVVVGGRASVWLPVPDLRSVVVLDDGDETLQEERAPTWHARDLAIERARRVGAPVVLVSPVPSLLPGAADRTPEVRTRRSGWPRAQVVDLRDEPPGGGLCAHDLGSAIHRALDGGGRAVCIVNRKGRARLLACRACGALARCTTCGAAVAQPGDDLECPRCRATRPPVCAECGSMRFRAVRPGVHAARDTVAALVPRVAVAEVDATTTEIGDAPVLVGTEAVLHRLTRRDALPPRLVAFLTFDEELFAARFRAHEQALWLLARAGRLLGPRGAGGVMLVQTRVPDHAVIRAAITGDLGEFAREESNTRRLLGLPPFGGLAELAGAPEAVALATAAVHDARVTVLGGRDGPALVRAPSFPVLADVLARTDFGPARARGRLRVEVDPPRV